MEDLVELLFKIFVELIPQNWIEWINCRRTVIKWLFILLIAIGIIFLTIVVFTIFFFVLRVIWCVFSKFVF